MSDGPCIAPECTRDVSVKVRQLCVGHYGQWQRGEELRPLRVSSPTPCRFADCEETASAKGLCRGHYGQTQRGRPLTPLRSKAKANQWDGEFKVCPLCGERKHQSEYRETTAKRTGNSGRYPYCLDCDHSRGIRDRATTYGLSAATMLELADRPCDICHAPAGSRGKAHSVDHCHETGAVRGVLCHFCNTALGKFKDSPEILARAIWYVTRGADYRTVDREDES